MLAAVTGARRGECWASTTPSVSMKTCSGMAPRFSSEARRRCFMEPNAALSTRGEVSVRYVRASTVSRSRDEALPVTPCVVSESMGKTRATLPESIFARSICEKRPRPPASASGASACRASRTLSSEVPPYEYAWKTTWSALKSVGLRITRTPLPSRISRAPTSGTARSETMAAGFGNIAASGASASSSR